jgi:hypothetical protein
MAKLATIWTDAVVVPILPEMSGEETDPAKGSIHKIETRKRSSSSNPNSKSRASKVGRSDGDSGPLRGDASNQGSPDTSLAMSAACFRL